MFQDKFNLAETKQFIAKFDDFFACSYPTGINQLQAIAFLRTKLDQDTREEFIRHFRTTTTWTSARQWLLTRRTLSLDSDMAKRELRKLRQNGRPLRAHFYALKRIAMRIDSYDGLDHDVREAFVESLDSRIAMNVRKDFDKEQAACARHGTSISDEWLLQTAMIEDAHTPAKTIQDLRVY